MADNIKVLKANGSNGSSLLDALSAIETNSMDHEEGHIDNHHEEHSFIDIVKQRAVEEYEDVVTYMELADKTDDKEFKQLLKDIACEEMTHGKVLEHIIMHSKEMPKDIKDAKANAEEIMNQK